PTRIYTLSLHDALPICPGGRARGVARIRHDEHPKCERGPRAARRDLCGGQCDPDLHPEPAVRQCRRWRSRRSLPELLARWLPIRSEEHTSELQSLAYLV